MKHMLTSDLLLRDVTEGDLPIFFEQQLDPEANHMAAFTAKDPSDRDAFMARWTRILGNETLTKKTILCDGHVAGHVLCFEQFGKPAVGYWIGKRYWGRGIATRALSAFLDHVRTRPLYARTVKENVASIRVLEKCGFVMFGEEKGFSNARGQEVEEVLLKLGADETKKLLHAVLGGIQELSAKVTGLEKELTAFRGEVNRRFDEVNNRFDKVDRDIEYLQGKLQEHDKEIWHLKRRQA